MNRSSAQARREARVWSARIAPLATALLLVSLATATAGAGPDRPTPTIVLGCRVSEEVPSPAATASDGGFTFLYQSVGGVTEDGRSCTVYRLKNEAGGPPTPVRWVAGDEVLIDLAQLHRCRDADGCPWFEVARYFQGEFDDGSTLLTFGLNADSFRQDSDGLIARTEPRVGEAAASVGTEVVGALTLADGSVVDLDLIVKSRFERRGGVVNLIYEVTASDPELLSGERIALSWPAFKGAPRRTGLAGEGAAVFLELPASRGAIVERSDDTVAVTVRASDFAYLPYAMLSVVEPGNPEFALLSVPLPAFVPNEP